MFGIEVWVLERGLPLKISATVDAAHTRLIAFYQSLGATIESSGKLRQLPTRTGSGQSPALRPWCCDNLKYLRSCVQPGSAAHTCYATAIAPSHRAGKRLCRHHQPQCSAAAQRAHGEAF